MLKAQRDLFIEKIFTEKEFFEKEILNVYSKTDRAEIMDILAKRIIRILLREELSFLYMKDLSNFKFSLIKHILFKEIASEWISYSYEKFNFTKDISLKIVQEKKHVLFLLELIKEYLSKHKVYFVEEIADSFIELIENMPNKTKDNALIREVLLSDFVRKEKVSVVYSYSQLWSRVRNAHLIKKEKITKLQIQISETSDFSRLKKLEYKEEDLTNRPLAFFDEALLRLRNAMIWYMLDIEEFKR